MKSTLDVTGDLWAECLGDSPIEIGEEKPEAKSMESRVFDVPSAKKMRLLCQTAEQSKLKETHLVEIEKLVWIEIQEEIRIRTSGDDRGMEKVRGDDEMMAAYRRPNH